jgi:hypothetical protein
MAWNVAHQRYPPACFLRYRRLTAKNDTVASHISRTSFSWLTLPVHAETPGNSATLARRQGRPVSAIFSFFFLFARRRRRDRPAQMPATASVFKSPTARPGSERRKIHDMTVPRQMKLARVQPAATMRGQAESRGTQTASSNESLYSDTGYRIMDSVRRAKAASPVGHTEIPAEVVESNGQCLGQGAIPVDGLRSPRALIRRITPADESR